jgi:hypothetical protein
MSERALMEQFKEFCYTNGGDITRDAESEGRSDLTCKIPGVGVYNFHRRSKVKKAKAAVESVVPLPPTPPRLD